MIEFVVWYLVIGCAFDVYDYFIYDYDESPLEFTAFNILFWPVALVDELRAKP